jgi:hypothetical protein
VLVYWDFQAGGLFLCPVPFSGAELVLCQQPLLSVCYDVSLFVVQFCGAVLLWVLFTSSGDELCEITAVLQGVAYTLSASLLFQCLFTDSSTEISSLPLPFSLVHFQHFCPLCCCARLQFAVCHSFFLGMHRTAQRLCWFVPGVNSE